MDETKAIDWYEKAIAWYEQIEKTSEFYQNFGEEYEAAQAALEVLREKLNRCKDGGINGPTMALIDRMAAKAFAREKLTSPYAICSVEYVLDSVPTIDAAPVVHARWVRKAGKVTCSHCGGFADWTSSGGWWEQVERPYCGRCGARMDGGEEHGTD